MDSTQRRLALHADDLGMNRAVTDGVLRGFQHGLLTSTSVLANAPDAGRALWLWRGLLAQRAEGRLASQSPRYALDDPGQPFDLGVHLNLTQGRPLSRDFPAALLDGSGRFLGVFRLFARLRRSGDRFCEAMFAELEQQTQVVCDHGLKPTHLNGHQYIEMMPAVSRIIERLLERFEIRTVRVPFERSLFRSTVLRGQWARWPLALVKRAFAGRFRQQMDLIGIEHADAYFGTAHAAGVDRRLLRCFLAGAPDRGLVEVGLHPGEISDGPSAAERADGWDDPLAALRPRELEMLCSEDLSRFLQSAGWTLGRLAPASRG